MAQGSNDSNNGSQDRRREDPRLRLLQEQILDKLEVIEAHQKESMELLILFKNTKGFITTLRSIGVVAMWLTGVGGSVSLILYGIRVWFRGGG